MAAICLHRLEEVPEVIQQLVRQAEAMAHQAVEVDKDKEDKATHRLHPSNTVPHRRVDRLHPSSTVLHQVVLHPSSMVLLPAEADSEDVHRLLPSSTVLQVPETVMVPADRVHLGKPIVEDKYRWNNLQILWSFTAHLNSMVPQAAAMVTDMDRMVAPGKWQVSQFH